jgi:hypothetical protein
MAIGNGTDDDQQELTLVQTKIICTEDKLIYSSLNDYGEKPLLHMVSHRKLNDGAEETINSYPTILFVNPNTGTWTLVEKHTENILCVVTIGQQLKPYSR